jgi:hypothetical protein
VQDSPATCNDPEGLIHCSGNTAYTCVNGLAFGEQCNRHQAACVEEFAGAAYCQPVQGTCDERGNVSCNGDVIEVCDTGGFLSLYDCGFADSSCFAQGSSLGWCLAPGCTTDDDDDEHCDGTTLVSFPGGARLEIDCTDYGFTGCREWVHPVTNDPYATCSSL